MTLEELRKLVADGEGDHVEFKETPGHRPYRQCLRKGASRPAPHLRRSRLHLHRVHASDQTGMER